MMKRLLLLAVWSLCGPCLWAQQIDPTYRPLITKRTADWCPNCGTWGWTFFHWLLEDLDGKAVIWAAHHSGDLETDASGAIADNFQGFSQPIFYLNETDLDVTSSNMSQKRTEVAQQVDALSQMVPVAGIGLDARIENATLYVDARVEFLQAAQGPLRLGLYLVEKKRVAPQAGQSDQAEHKRLLRTALTDEIFGVVLSESGMQAGETFSHSLSFALTDPLWTADNLSVVGVLWQAAGNKFVPLNALQTDEFGMPTAVENPSAPPQLKLWPNPAGQVAYLSFSGRAPDVSALRLVDLYGRVWPVAFREQGNVVAVELSGLPQGLYFVSIREGRIAQQVRLVVVP